MHGGLAGGIATTDDEDVFIDADVGFAGAGAVVEADVEEFFFIGKPETAVGHARGTDGCVGNDGGAVREMSNALAGEKFTAHAFAEHENFRAEASGLFARSLGEIRAADSLRKS